MADQEADFNIELSSEMISDIVQRYFNNEMFKVPVQIVDGKASAAGYVFSVTFAEHTVTTMAEDIIMKQHNILQDNLSRDIMEKALPVQLGGRNSKGHFTKKVEHG